MTPERDLERAATFIEALTGSVDAAVTFQTFDDAKLGRPLKRILHGTLAKHVAELERLNDSGAGVFVMVNEGDGIVHPGERSCRTNASVVGLRALFIDCDNGPPERYALRPSFIVHSRRGPQAYWLLEPGVPLATFGPAQKQLAAFYGSDPSVNDLARVMRVPGFLHRKAEPFLATFEGAS